MNALFTLACLITNSMALKQFTSETALPGAPRSYFGSGSDARNRVLLVGKGACG